MRSLKTEGAKCRDIQRCRANPHWNYPTDILLMDRKLFNELTKATTEHRQHMFDSYIENLKTNTDTPFVNAFFTMLKYIAVTKEEKDRMYQHHMVDFRELLLKPGTFDTFLEKSLVGFDVFGLGFTLLYVLSRVKLWMEVKTVLALEELFLKMMTPNVYKRLSITQALDEYKKIIADMS